MLRRLTLISSLLACSLKINLERFCRVFVPAFVGYCLAFNLVLFTGIQRNLLSARWVKIYKQERFKRYERTDRTLG